MDGDVNSNYLNNAARNDFERARRKAFMEEIKAFLGRRPNTLMSFEEVQRALPIQGQIYRGIKQVPVADIMGSVDRYHDFDRNFLPDARSVSRTSLRGLIPTARASAPLGGVLSAYQRSLQALAQAMGNPARSSPGGDEAARHAQTFLQQPQSP